MGIETGLTRGGTDNLRHSTPPTSRVRDTSLVSPSVVGEGWTHWDLCDELKRHGVSFFPYYYRERRKSTDNCLKLVN